MDDAKYFPVTSTFIFQCYHPYGNTPPEDLLQSITTDVPQPDVLLLGCGDLRSCLYTLWNNFDHKHARNFKGVHFVLNDINAAVLARNIIFLYLCTQMPTNSNDKVKWVAAFWAIWYCHELLPHHKRVLRYALSNLLKWSVSIESWKENKDNPLRSLVKYTTVASLSQIRQKWRNWYDETLTVKEMLTNRFTYFQLYSGKFHQNPMVQLQRYFGSILLQKFTESERKILKRDVRFYFKNGSAFGEEVLGLPVDESTSVNSTFIEIPGRKYNLPCGLTPYKNFFLTYQFSPKNMEAFNYSDFPLMVKDDQFIQKPLLANSIQQFSIWVRSCAEILSQSDHDIVFTVQCSDATEFCQQLHHNRYPHLPRFFDAIYSSNLIDYIAPPSLVLLAMLVLKPDGALFTSVFYYYVNDTNTCKEFLKRGFGFDCKHLQLLCGVRCLGYENEYSDFLTIKPVFVSDLDLDTIVSVGIRSLIWRHVIVTPMKQITEKSFAFMWNTLSTAITHLLTSHIDSKSQGMIYSCTGTVMILLQSFALQLDRDEYDCTSYQFWEPLCHLFLGQNRLHPFFVSIQTQAMLCNLHLHLIVSWPTCPFCTKESVDDFVTKYSITVPKRSAFNFAGKDNNFRILISDKPITNQSLIFNLNTHTDIHILDTVAVSTSETDENNIIEFFGLDSYLFSRYYVSVMTGATCMQSHEEISSFKATTKQGYTFHRLEFIAQIKQSSVSSDLGEVLQHSGDESHFESTVSLNDQALLALKSYQLDTIRSRDTCIKFKVDKYCTTISYPYSVDYKKLSIKLSRKNKKVIVIANRIRHYIHDEDPVFIVNPDNKLSLPIMPIEETTARSFSGDILWYHIFRPITDEAVLNLKRTFANIFNRPSQQFCCLCHRGQPFEAYNPTPVYFIAALNWVFNIHNNTPAIDILFWDTKEKPYPFWKLKWPNLIEFVNDAEEQLARKVFNYFAKCTVTTLPPPKENPAYQYLVQNKIEQHFTRAVIHPLYSNVDERTMDQSQRDVFHIFLHTNHEKPVCKLGFIDPSPCMASQIQRMHG